MIAFCAISLQLFLLRAIHIFGALGEHPSNNRASGSAVSGLRIHGSFKKLP
jgi:hypothetical protein